MAKALVGGVGGGVGGGSHVKIIYNKLQGADHTKNFFLCLGKQEGRSILDYCEKLRVKQISTTGTNLTKNCIC